MDAKTEVMQQVRQQAAIQNARLLVEVNLHAPAHSIPQTQGAIANHNPS